MLVVVFETRQAGAGVGVGAGEGVGVGVGVGVGAGVGLLPVASLARVPELPSPIVAPSPLVAPLSLAIEPPSIDLLASVEPVPAPAASVAGLPTRTPVDIFDFPEPKSDSSRTPPAAMHAELAALRQEFSVVARIERSHKKRWIWLAVGLLAAGALVVILTSGPPRTERIAQDAAPTRKPYESVVRREAAHDPTPAPLPVRTESPPEVAPVLPENPKVEAKLNKGDKVTLVVPTVDPKRAALTPEQFAALTEDEIGKSETRVVFDPGEAARKAVADAAAKKAAVAGTLAEDVALAFGKKKAQFAKCSDDTQERVKVVFTVTATGKTNNTLVEGTNSGNKSRCIKAILERSVFPAGNAANTYSQTLVL